MKNRILRTFSYAILSCSLLASTCLVAAPVALKRQQSNIQTPALNWALEDDQAGSLHISKSYSQVNSGKDVIVAVIDTGVDSTHPLIKNNLLSHDGKGQASSNDFGMDFSSSNKNNYRPNDQHGHGTHIAGIIKSVFPKVKILPIKYYNPDAGEQTNLNATVQSIEYAVSMGVDIINYSSGGAGASLDELRALKKAESQGILVVAAAGNYGADIDRPENRYYPASYGLKNILTVINHDQNLKLNPSSNFGKNSADISAPGSRIRSSLPHGRYGYLSGTSQSTAFVSGVAAMIKSRFPDATPTQIKEIIKKSARKSTLLSGRCQSEGALDAELALNQSYQFFNVAKPEGTRKLAGY